MKTTCQIMARQSQTYPGRAEAWCEVHNAPIANKDVCVVGCLEALTIELRELREEFVKFKELFVGK